MKKTVYTIIASMTLVLSCVLAFMVERNIPDNDLLNKNIEVLTGGETFDYESGYPYYTTCNAVVGSFLGIPVRCGNTIVICQGGGNGCNEHHCSIHP